MITSPEIREAVTQKLSYLFGEELMKEVLDTGTLVDIPAQSYVIDIGDPIDFLPIVLEGSLKILTEDSEGRDLLLYYLENGETCAVTLNCCARASKSKIRAIAETDTRLISIPIEQVEIWMSRYADWRAFLFETYNYRMNELLVAIDTLAFSNMHERVMKYLRDKAMVTGRTQLPVTHQEIANDLHSSRVVISRVMKKLEIDGHIQQNRQEVILKDF
ncbi:MAG: Crp/Fnr family transcriptional regulator [Flavobacteriales bacterium]|nr:Crp/Fnr family transcriptional regulator [Bacteroidota bacterium]MCB9240123.1 Crp/Fnr family transcriptional regulator [Flavobacteriales bacterium]